MKKPSSEIIQVSNLSTYFFDKLYQLNQSAVCPLPEETLFYASNVLNKYAQSSMYFDFSGDKVTEKVYGMALLKAESESKSVKEKMYKDIADSTLVLTSMFEASINKKIITKNYYTEIGKTAYSKMHDLDQDFMGIPHFYRMMASSFDHLAFMIKSIGRESFFQDQAEFILKSSATDSTIAS
jgi:hypothetical protein